MSIVWADGIGKAYRTYASEWHRVGRWFGLPTRPREEKWVLRNVHLDIAPGEAVGVVGQNGAGKSTLLKMLAGSLMPTEGSVTVHGTTSAILELGLGFNPDFSGRRNAYHAAGLMGLSGALVDELMPEIEAFAELGDYFDEPVRTYSSGMQMRLAFSVVTARRPDVLIVDEALSVGDAYFQHKSFGRIREFREKGTTLLLVSHDKTSIQALCNRAILLEEGTVIKDGDPEEVMDFYNALIAQKEESAVRVDRSADGRARTVSGTGEAAITTVELRRQDGSVAEEVRVGEPAWLRVEAEVRADLPTLVFGFMIKDRLGQPVFGTNTWHTEQILRDVKAGQRFRFEVGFEMDLGAGSYSVSTALVSTDTHLVGNYEWRDLAYVFTVTNVDKPHFVGTSWLPSRIEVSEL